MQEDTTTELNLHEEQLQGAVGGCNDCHIDRGIAINAANNSQAQLLHAETLRLQGHHELADAHEEAGRASARVVGEAMGRIIARGHLDYLPR